MVDQLPWVQIAAIAADLTAWLQLLALDGDLAHSWPPLFDRAN
jgi:hypothetical protein